MGWRTLNGVQEFHRGMDIPAPLGTKIYAAADGVVSTKAHYTYGTCVKLSHGGGLVTIYAHMSAWAEGIADGVPVKQGQLIGYVGRTGRAYGYHLHFEANLNGAPWTFAIIWGSAFVWPCGHARPGRRLRLQKQLRLFGKAVHLHDSRRRCAASCAAPRARQCPGRSLFFMHEEGTVRCSWTAAIRFGRNCMRPAGPLFRCSAKRIGKSKNGFEPYKGSDGRNCVSASCEPCLVQLPLTIPGHCKMY